tara:strand:- start:52 stop:474 length:423 start_codon:yes stop_codon:yes gene_type:complete
VNAELTLNEYIGTKVLPGSKRIVNCTPHSIEIWGDDGRILEIEAEGAAARCRMDTRHLGDFTIGTGRTSEISDFSVPLFGIAKEMGMVTDNLPSPSNGTMYVVSKIVAAANPERDDLLLIWDTVRDEEGKVIGCRGLSLP